MAPWVKVPITNRLDPHGGREEPSLTSGPMTSHACYEGIHNKYFKIPFILFVLCAHMYISYMYRGKRMAMNVLELEL